MTMTTASPKRRRLVKATVGVALAGISFSLIETGVADAAVSPPLNVTVSNVAGPAINIDWDTPTTGDPVTYYRLIIDNTSTPLSPDFVTFVPSAQTAYTDFAVTPLTTYNITVESNDDSSAAPTTVVPRRRPGLRSNVRGRHGRLSALLTRSSASSIEIGRVVSRGSTS